MVSRGPYAKSIAKREEILGTALRLFARDGYDRLSFREIARECGLSQAGLLHHFSTKEELFTEVLRRRDDWDGDPGGQRHRHSLTHLQEAVAHNVSEPELVRLFVAMSAEGVDPEASSHEYFRERYRWLRSEIVRDVRVQQESGTISSDLDAEDVAMWSIALADGLQLQWLLDPSAVDMAGSFQRAVAVLRAGAAATGAAGDDALDAVEDSKTSR